MLEDTLRTHKEYDQKGFFRWPLIRDSLQMPVSKEYLFSRLFQIISIGDAVIPQGIAHGPDFGDDGGCLFKQLLSLQLLDCSY